MNPLEELESMITHCCLCHKHIIKMYPGGLCYNCNIKSIEYALSPEGRKERDKIKKWAN